MLKERFEVTMMEAEGMPPETLKQHIAEADPVGIVGMVNVPITDDIMAAAPHLRVVANYAAGYNNVDASLSKRFKVAGARYLEIRAEAFNLLNHPNFGPPGRDINTPQTFGIVTSTVGNPRLIELVAKFFF